MLKLPKIRSQGIKKSKHVFQTPKKSVWQHTQKYQSGKKKIKRCFLDTCAIRGDCIGALFDFRVETHGILTQNEDFQGNFEK